MFLTCAWFHKRFLEEEGRCQARVLGGYIAQLRVGAQYAEHAGKAGKARLKGHNLQPSRSATVVEVKVFLRFGGSEICQKPLFRDEKGVLYISCIQRKV